jgi:hypothetical protein
MQTETLKNVKEKLADTKDVIISRLSNKDGNYNGLRKKEKRRTMIYKTLHRKLPFAQHEQY